MKKALGYIRVSSKAQATDGAGLEDQRDAITEWAARNGYEIVGWFEDRVTGELPWDKRPAMRSLVERLAVNGIDAVLVHQLDRVARGKSGIFEAFYEVVQLAKVQVISVVDGVLTEVEGDEFKSADAELVRTIKQAIVRAEKRKLVARMTLGRIRAKAEGRRICGEYFYGTDPSRPEEVATLTRMRQLRAEGLTCYAIAKRLDVEGLKPRKAAKWAPNAVDKILTRVLNSTATQAEPLTQQSPAD
jgi:DNA invertase Pin-like site-specific DNA recombinase